MDPGDLGLELLVADPAGTRWPTLDGVVGAGSELQRGADRLDSPATLSRIDVADEDATEPSPTAVGYQDASERPYSAQYHVKDCQPDDLPELLVCAAANISDKNVTPAGSSVTSFVFSKKLDWWSPGGRRQLRGIQQAYRRRY